MALEQPVKNCLLTGLPGCGKTTVVHRLAERLRDLRLRGFYTEELREHGQRVGFEAVSFSGRKAVLAHVQSRSRCRVGRYGVEPDQLEPLVAEELAGLGASLELYKKMGFVHVCNHHAYQRPTDEARTLP